MIWTETEQFVTLVINNNIQYIIHIGGKTRYNNNILKSKSFIRFVFFFRFFFLKKKRTGNKYNNIIMFMYLGPRYTYIPPTTII